MPDRPPVTFLIGELLGDVQSDLAAAAQRRVSESGFEDIRSTHDCVFRFLDPRGVRLRDLAGKAGMTPQSVGEHVDDLERLGYVERVPDPSDRRAKLIRPTERGRAVMDAARRALAEIEREWNAAVGPRAVLQLRKTLEAVRELQRSRSQA